MEIKTFGKISEIVNKKLELVFPISFTELKTAIEEQFPALKTLHYKIAINDELISEEDHIIAQPQSIAIMPPFSGG